jgi:AcrR family transcriptional regulator
MSPFGDNGQAHCFDTGCTSIHQTVTAEVTMTDDPKPARDREATERRLLDAARAVLAASGAEGFGVNAVARAAGCDKQLIYRYFGGLDGLLDAIGADLADWWADRLRPETDQPPPASYGELMLQLGLALIEALRSDALARQIALWELSSPTDQVQRLAAARSRAMAAWMLDRRGTLTPPPGVDAPAVNALLAGAVLHLVLAGQTAGQSTGLTLRTDADWDRVRLALGALLAGLYPA